MKFLRVGSLIFKKEDIFYISKDDELRKLYIHLRVKDEIQQFIRNYDSRYELNKMFHALNMELDSYLYTGEEWKNSLIQEVENISRYMQIYEHKLVCLNKEIRLLKKHIIKLVKVNNK